MNKFWHWLKISATVCFFGAFCLFFLSHCYVEMFMTERVCTEEAEVIQVGGCDEYGECGVYLSNGEYNYAPYPVVGQTICTKREKIYKE